MELTIEDLLTNCDACQGTGRAAPFAHGYPQRHWRLLFGYRPKPCPECDGRGFTPTETGFAVLGFLARSHKRGLLTLPPVAVNPRQWPAWWLLRRWLNA